MEYLKTPNSVGIKYAISDGWAVALWFILAYELLKSGSGSAVLLG